MDQVNQIGIILDANIETAAAKSALRKSFQIRGKRRQDRRYTEVATYRRIKTGAPYRSGLYRKIHNRLVTKKSLEVYQNMAGKR